MAATYDSIATTTLGSAAASITFSSIASSWTDLRIVLNVNTTSVNTRYILMRFNSDSGANYSYTSLGGNGSITFSSNGINNTEIYVGDAATTSSTLPTFYTSDIFSYAGSTYKTALSTGSADKNGSGVTERTVGLWRSTSTINSIILLPFTGNFNTGTTATLYGIKNA